MNPETTIVSKGDVAHLAGDSTLIAVSPKHWSRIITGCVGTGQGDESPTWPETVAPAKHLDQTFFVFSLKT
jgi:hypothetical protein